MRFPNKKKRAKEILARESAYKRGFNRGASESWRARNNRHLPRIAVRV